MGATRQLDRPEAYARSFEERKRAFIVRTGRKLRPWINGAIARWSLVPDTPVLNKADFPWTRMLEENWETIQAELQALLEYRDALPPLHEISPDHRRITKDESWKSFFLWGYGYRVDANCRRCPETARIVEQIPNLKSALFSILTPHAHIPRHKGVTKGMITCHLALNIPQERDKCRIQVDDQVLYWEPGKTMVFDDTYKHEVWNDTDEERVVLLMQFTRPMRPLGRLVNAAFLALVKMTAYYKEPKKNMATFEERFQAAVRRAESFQIKD